MNANHTPHAAKRRCRPGARVRLLARAPRDGSMDFYLSMMLGVPVPRVRLLRLAVDGSRNGEGRGS
ncbi:hypothetical protein Uis1B_2247 [Bifidobacterium margollesii]|uniref:Uncharacterized protein n=1 Tax=Bifidobacterium margollesii TaxID=2020964 RepID=A0A2N5J6W0_9BIFI|nr:hypothetical protein Uis1B_2247 [Bifidobacterium margollesii]